MSEEGASKNVVCYWAVSFISFNADFLVSEEKEEDEETEDAGLDDWEAMVSDEDEEKGGHVNTKWMLFLIKRFHWAEFFVSVENNVIFRSSPHPIR